MIRFILFIVWIQISRITGILINLLIIINSLLLSISGEFNSEQVIYLILILYLEYQCKLVYKLKEYKAKEYKSLFKQVLILSLPLIIFCLLLSFRNNNYWNQNPNIKSVLVLNILGSVLLALNNLIFIIIIEFKTETLIGTEDQTNNPEFKLMGDFILFSR